MEWIISTIVSRSIFPLVNYMVDLSLSGDIIFIIRYLEYRYRVENLTNTINWAFLHSQIFSDLVDALQTRFGVPKQHYE